MKGKTRNASANESSASIEALQRLRIVIRAAQRHSAWIEKQCGVSGAQLWVLQELQDSPGLRVGALAARLAIHQTTASNLVEALAVRGHVLRARDSGDKRAVLLSLSAKGARLLARAPKPAKGLLPEALDKMDSKALSQLNKGLKGLLDVIAGDNDAAGLQPLPFTM